ncbi:porin [Aeromonas jandaei]|uniref:porin n=1 Tax=Aeromonas jandaei TaxID=650 RepID=UPI00191D51CD|nr:porin [Aeromonas jandaei]MBL0597786.1 porin [Aeromonas jandaei]
MFKKSALAVVIASAFALPAHADIKNVDIYGQIAISAWSGADYATQKNADGSYDKAIKVDNESRIGLRGSKDFTNGPKFIWQIESGDVGDSGETGKFGVRDTFGGFEWEGIGKVRAGRMLTPLYELVDWPYSSIAAGKVFDWGGDIVGGANYDRQSNMIRFDSAKYSGFSYNLAIGRGNDESDASSNFYGLGAHYNNGPLTLHAAYERGNDRKVSNSTGASYGYFNHLGNKYTKNFDITQSGFSNTDAYLLGFELNFDNGLGFYGAWKNSTAKYQDVKIGELTPGSTQYALNQIEQDSYSLGAIYNYDKWQFKIAYAANLKPDYQSEGHSGSVSEFSDSLLSGQVMYFLDDSAVTYLRPYQLQRRGAGQVQDGDKEFGIGAGVEYYF